METQSSFWTQIGVFILLAKVFINLRGIAALLEPLLVAYGIIAVVSSIGAYNGITERLHKIIDNVKKSETTYKLLLQIVLLCLSY